MGIRIGTEVIVYDRYRFAIPLMAVVCRQSRYNDGIKVVLLQSNNPHYPIHSTVWVHEQQLKVSGGGAPPEDFTVDHPEHRETITALREHDNQVKGLHKLRDEMNQNYLDLMAEQQAHIDDLQDKIERLNAALDRYEQYFVGRSHACNGRDCIGFWQEPTGSLPRCNECVEVIELGKERLKQE